MEITMIPTINAFRFLLCDHAALRSAQRDIPPKAISFLLLFGDWHSQQRRQKYWQPHRNGKRPRCEVTLSRHHIPPEEFIALQRYAGSTVVLAEFSDIVTVKKTRSRESWLRQPYIRERVHWQEHLRRSMMDM
jgi:hypothetical protein